MREYNNFQEYIDAQKVFKESFDKSSSNCNDIDECNWSVFKDSFFKFTNNKCPICEDTLNRYDDIDHYRPKAKYSFLKCCCKNYIILCADCNRAHKGSKFPLGDKFMAKSQNELSREIRLLINPRNDNIYNYFQLVFRRINNGKLVLEIHPKDNLSKNQYEAAKKTISTYGIGYCNSNKKIDSCRINILETHYEMFIEFAQELIKSKKTFDELINNNRSMRKRKEYGFIKFLELNQFKILI